MYLYPGGSAVEPDTYYFNIQKNYWCDLYKKTAHNGEQNGGMLFAKLASISIAAGFSLFWVAAPIKIIQHRSLRTIAQVCGVIAMIFGAMIFTSFHDLVIILGGISGAIAFSIILYYLKINKQTKLYRLGVFAFVLIGINNLVYFFDFITLILAVLQKLTFLIVFVWVTMLSLYLIKDVETS